MSQPVLELSGIHAAYLRKEILQGMSLTVSSGEIVAILGENGAGKSTILRVVAGLLRPSKGTVTYQGRDLDGLDIGQRQRLGIGYLMQGGRVFPNLTVQENFELSVAAARPEGRGLACLGDWFPLLCDHRADRAGLLSGGQRQMLAIELVIAQQPRLLLLDEPTAALSEEFAAQLLLKLQQYVLRVSAAALLVEQNAQLALSVVHRHVILADATFGKAATSYATGK